MPKPENVTLVDMDGTLCDYQGSLRKEMEKILAPNEKLPDDIWEAGDHWQKRRKLIQAKPGFWENLAPLPTGIMLLRMLWDLDYRIMVLTNGPSGTPEAWTEKVKWCQKHIRYKHEITITLDKGLCYGRVLVDDYPAYIERWLQWRNNGIVIMPAQPWNREFKHKQVTRYVDGETKIQEIKDILEAHKI